MANPSCRNHRAPLRAGFGGSFGSGLSPVTSAPRLVSFLTAGVTLLNAVPAAAAIAGWKLG